MRLIDAELLKREIIKESTSPLVARRGVLPIIDDMPTIDAELVRRGRWLEGKCFECSECKARAAFAVLSKGDGKENVALELLSNYCPNCGARMGEEK